MRPKLFRNHSVFARIIAPTNVMIRPTTIDILFYIIKRVVSFSVYNNLEM
jgi:hypothetical protein